MSKAKNPKFDRFEVSRDHANQELRQGRL